MTSEASIEARVDNLINNYLFETHVGKTDEEIATLLDKTVELGKATFKDIAFLTALATPSPLAVKCEAAIIRYIVVVARKKYQTTIDFDGRRELVKKDHSVPLSDAERNEVADQFWFHLLSKNHWHGPHVEYYEKLKEPKKFWWPRVLNFHYNVVNTSFEVLKRAAVELEAQKQREREMQAAAESAAQPPQASDD